MNQSRCNLSNLIIAGVHKAGTTSLYTYLSRHRQICPSYKKEIGFFSPLASGKPLRPIAEYERHFAHCRGERFRLEASPSYLYGKERIAEAIKNELKDPRIILILREPVDRLVSYFSRALSKDTLPDKINFSDYVEESQQHLDSEEVSVYARGMREGVYINYLPIWQRIFGPDLRVVFFDDLMSNTTALMADIYAWLGLDASEVRNKEFAVENRTMQYRSKNLHRRIRDFYMQHEVFWRRHHGLKQGLRRLYNVLNTESSGAAGTVDPTSLAKLGAFYAPYNVQLGDFLKSNQYTSLPSWLRSRT